MAPAPAPPLEETEAGLDVRLGQVLASQRNRREAAPDAPQAFHLQPELGNCACVLVSGSGTTHRPCLPPPALPCLYPR